MVICWWDFTDEEFAQFNFRLYDREDHAAASPSFLMHVTPATSAMPQDLSAVWGQWSRWDSSPLHLEKWQIWYFNTNKYGPLIINLLRLIFCGPQVTDSKLCAHFHSTKVRVGASDGSTVAKDPDDGWVRPFGSLAIFCPTCRQPVLRCGPKRCRRRAVHQGKHFLRRECLQ